MESSLRWYCQLRFLSIFTRRYLILSVGYSLLPHNFYFKSSSNFFCLDLKIIISVFFTVLYHISFFQFCQRGKVLVLHEITTQKAENYLKVWGALACLSACLILTNKFSVWVYRKVFCCFWPIKPCDLFQIGLQHSFERQIMVVH